MVSIFTRAGVPVFKRNVRIPASRKDFDKVFTVLCSSGPETVDVCPLKTLLVIYVPAVKTTALLSIKVPSSNSTPMALPSLITTLLHAASIISK